MAEKNVSKKTHEALTEVPNLHVLKLMQSLKSKGFVKETFNWYDNPTILYPSELYLLTLLSWLHAFLLSKIL